jgi:hypothetical protein
VVTKKIDAMVSLAMAAGLWNLKKGAAPKVEAKIYFS